MYQILKSEIKEIIEIVKQCPESLQEKCFELLLEKFLNANATHTTPVHKNTDTSKSDITTDEISPTKDETSEEQNQDTEIAMKDFHVKIQHFLNNNSVTIDIINNIYYKENCMLMPLYDSLNSTSMAECQIRLALLTAFENSFSDNNGEMGFNCEVVRSRCNAMKCYNSKNFASYFKANSDFWENWPEKYDKSLCISLSKEGKKELAKILLDLGKGE